MMIICKSTYSIKRYDYLQQNDCTLELPCMRTLEQVRGGETLLCKRNRLLVMHKKVDKILTGNVLFRPR